MVDDSPTPSQIRGARAMLNWSMVDLSKATNLSISSIKRAEDDEGIPISNRLKGAFQSALESAGIIFLPDDGQGAGVRLAVRSRGERARPSPDLVRTTKA